MARIASTTGDRRRRVLTEQLVAGASAAAPEAGSTDAGPTKAYGPDALASQARLTDLVPRRYSTIFLLSFLALLAAAGITALEYYQPKFARWVAPEQLAAFDSSRPGSLAAWYASLLLILSAGLALVIYSVRRHRVDDYRGRYRVWWLATGTCLAISLGFSTGLHRAIGDILLRTSGLDQRFGLIAWLGPVALVVGFAWIRLVLESLNCRLAVAGLVLAAVVWSLGIAISTHTLAVGKLPAMLLAHAACPLGGCVLFLTALLLKSRHVLLDAEGHLPLKIRPAKKPKVKTAKTKSESKAPAEASDEEEAKSPKRGSRKPVEADADPSPATTSARAPKVAVETTRRDSRSDAEEARWSRTDDDYETDDDEDGNSDRLSKAERKRLRRQARGDRNGRNAA